MTKMKEAHVALRNANTHLGVASLLLQQAPVTAHANLVCVEHDLAQLGELVKALREELEAQGHNSDR